MNDFNLWFSTGIEHILDIEGYDHIAYIIALTVIFKPKEWRKILILVTAFTIGHSITLAMSTLRIININRNLIEIMIPITILVTCINNIWLTNKNQRSIIPNYITALCFGFIHGMGFSYLLRSMLGKQESILSPLFSFNLGLEAGQIIIVACVIVITAILSLFLKVSSKVWVITISTLVGLVSCYLIFQRVSLTINS